MPDWKETTRDLGRQVVLDQLARIEERRTAVFTEGFNEAANICVNALTDTIAELMAKIQSGSYLSTEEQFLLSRLTKLKIELEEKLYSFFGTEAEDR
ncbi:hypothetical protein AB0D97_33720 [Streptomyces roseus]|uniref:hypothetical protein n=1 Tax=Streptomyces roseus TaxID=66430 RepID=UPI00340C800D